MVVGERSGDRHDRDQHDDEMGLSQPATRRELRRFKLMLLAGSVIMMMGMGLMLFLINGTVRRSIETERDQASFRYESCVTRNQSQTQSIAIIKTMAASLKADGATNTARLFDQIVVQTPPLVDCNRFLQGTG